MAESSQEKSFIIRPESSAHWYDKGGAPNHTMPNASKPGQLRATTLRDARKLDLVPSVTSILSVVERPSLSAWKQQNILCASQAFADRDIMITENHKLVAIAAKCVGRVAMDLGSAYHTAAEGLCAAVENNVEYRYGLTAMPQVTEMAFIEWHKQHRLSVENAESSFAFGGYGGRIDWTGYASLNDPETPPGYSVIDWKTTRTKPGENIICYPEQRAQLAAYARGVGRPGAQRANVYISTTEPGRIECVFHEDYAKDIAYFDACFALWREVKSFDPR